MFEITALDAENRVVRLKGTKCQTQQQAYGQISQAELDGEIKSAY